MDNQIQETQRTQTISTNVDPNQDQFAINMAKYTDKGKKQQQQQH